MENEKIAKLFLNAPIISIEENKHGRIHDTFIVTYQKDNNIRKALFQKINKNVFNNIPLLMNNLISVTSFLEKKNVPTLHLLKTNEGFNYYIYKGSYYRCFDYIDNTISYDHPTESKTIYEIGKAYGEFLSFLDDFPLSSFESVLEDFHNTKKRFDDLVSSFNQDSYNRKDNIKEEIVFIFSKKDYIDSLFSLLENKEIPLHVIHGDTKANNVILDKDTNKYRMVVDLDTLLKDTLLFDYGDGVRSIASTKMDTIDISIFKSFTEGFIDGSLPILKEVEVRNFVLSVLVVTLELAIRYLTDYLSGDVYFKVENESCNLVRCRHQLAFFAELEKNYNLLNEEVLDIYKKKKNQL